MKKYKIELNSKQLQLLSEACEFTARFICGQVETNRWPTTALNHKKMKSEDFEDWIERRDRMNDLMVQIKQIGWDCSKNTHYGVGFDINSDILFEMYQVFAHTKWKYENNEEEKFTSRNSKSANEPTLNVSQMPFVTCNIIEE